MAPMERFYEATAVEGDGSKPVLTIQWSKGSAVHLNGVPFDVSAVERLARISRRAARQAAVVLPPPPVPSLPVPDLLLAFGEYLDGEGLMLPDHGEGATTDDRSHEDLARDFLVDLAERRGEV